MVQEILLLAGQPFITSPKPFLGVLEVESGIQFGDDVATAVQWAGQKYGFEPSQLRPRPL